MIDLLDLKIKNINPIYKKSFLISFAICIFVYFTILSNVFWGNHDWESIQYGILLNESTYIGRFAATILASIFCFTLTPYLVYMCCFAISIISFFLIADYWGIERKVGNLVVFSLFWTLMPSTLSYLYYRTHCLGMISTILFSILSIKLCSSISTSKTLTKARKICYFLLSFIFLYAFVLGTYPTTLNAIAVLVIGKFLIEFKNSNFALRSFKQSFQEHKYFLVNLFLALGIMKITILALSNLGIVNAEMYNISFTHLPQLLERFILTAKLCVSSLFLAEPFVSGFIKTLLFILIVASFVIFNKQLWQIKEPAYTKSIKFITLSLLYFAMLYFSFSSYILCEGLNQLNVRILHLGVDFVYLFAIAMIIKEKSSIIKNINTSIILLVLCNFAIHNNDAQLQSLLSFQNEMFLQNRLLTQIVNTKNFDANKTYNYFQIGQYPNYNRIFYQKELPKIENEEALNFTFVSQDGCSAALQYLSNIRFIKKEDSASYEMSNIVKNDMNKGIHDFILYKAQPYPNQNSIYINDDTIIVVMDENFLNEIKEEIKKIDKEKE